MPIWLRKYTFTRLQEYYRKQNEELEKAKGKSTLKGSLPKGPNIRKPSYTTKAGK